MNLSPRRYVEKGRGRKEEKGITAYIYYRNNNKKNLVAVDSLKPVFDETIFLLRRGLGQGFFQK